MSDPRVECLTASDLPAVRELLAAAEPEIECAAEEKVFGPGATARAVPYGIRTAGGSLVGLAVRSSRWLRLITSHPEHRNRGIGSALLDRCIGDTRRHDCKVLRLMDQPGNYVSPGIESTRTDAIAWLERRGFEQTSVNTNLIVDVSANEAVTEANLEVLSARCRRSGYDVERVSAESSIAARNESVALAAQFGGAWNFEVERAVSCDPGSVFVARQRTDGQLVAFAAHDGNNCGMGWFGPAGTLEKHRGNGLGAALLVGCLLDIKASKLRISNIAWIGPREFYKRVAGISGERTFVSMKKELK